MRRTDRQAAGANVYPLQAYMNQVMLYIHIMATNVIPICFIITVELSIIAVGQANGAEPNVVNIGLST